MNYEIKLNIFPSVNRLVAKEIIKYIDWLKERYSFPEQLTIIITGASYLVSDKTGNHVTSTFGKPWGEQKDYYMKIAVGDFFEMHRWGRRNAVYSILNDISYGLMQYYDLLSTEKADFNEEEIDKKATQLTIDYSIERGVLLGDMYRKIHHWGMSAVRKYRNSKSNRIKK
ncbi:hypothetical protein [Lactococcus lactis]|uniref:hypothetical protein n=1 Tax=Lactococcus lactis TaxID=1358 RepID=UPI0006401651|nr:hypothetical protein [Lactococcus lactis]KLK96206.1 phosphoesterase [Lactococcus lactis subsp. lactis]MCT1172133.1 hypothetical protein [Lactococcus lactis]MDV4191891.1 hypothetical protein [Lactococcus lactis subsp. lactis]